MQKRTINAKHNKLVYSLAVLGKDCGQALVSTFIFVYSMQSVDLSIGMIGTIYIIQAVISIILFPFIGMLLDSTTSRYGKYKPWICGATLANLVGLVAFYYLPQVPQEHAFAFYICAYITWVVSYNLLSLPLWSCLTTFNEDLTMRDRMASIPCIAYHLGHSIYVMCVLPIVNTFNISSYDISHFYYVLLSLSIGTLLLSQLPMLLWFKHESNIPKTTTPHRADQHSSYNMALNADAIVQRYQHLNKNTHEHFSSNDLERRYAYALAPAYNYQQDYGAVEDPNYNFSHSALDRQAMFRQNHSRDYTVTASGNMMVSHVSTIVPMRNQLQNQPHPSSQQVSRSAKIAARQNAQNKKRARQRLRAQRNKMSLTRFQQQFHTYIQMFLKNDQLMVVCLLTLLCHVIYGIILGAFLSFFIKRELLGHINIYAILTVGGVLQIASMMLYESIARKTSRSLLFNLSIYIFSIGFALLLVVRNNWIGYNTFDVGLSNTLFFTVLATSFFAANIGMGLNRVAITSMSLDTVDYGEFRLSVRTDGFIFAMRSQAMILANVFSYFFYGGIVSVLALSTDHQDIEQLPLPMSTLFSLAIVICLSVLAIMFYHSMYKLNGAFYRNILNNLQYLRQHNKSGTPHDIDSDHFMLRYCLDESTMLIKLKARNVDDIINSMVQKLSEVNAITSEHDYISDLKARLELGPCGIAEGIALPHAKSPAVRRATVVVATLDTALDLGALDDRKCDLVFLLASPDDGNTHLKLLGRLSLLLNEQGFADKLRSSGSPTELFERLVQCEKHVVR